MSRTDDIKAVLAPFRAEVQRNNNQIVALTEQLAAEDARHGVRRARILQDIVDVTARRDLTAQAITLLKGLK